MPPFARRSSRTILIALIVVAVAKGLLWATVIPAWDGPDEASHFAYIEGIVEDHWVPRQTDPNAGLYYPNDLICSENNLGVTFTGPMTAQPPFDLPWPRCARSSAADRHASAPINTAASYGPLYYASAIPFYLLGHAEMVEIRLALVRLWSVLLGVLATVFAYLALRRAFPESLALATAGAVLFTLQPMNAQQMAVVNNDALLIAVAAAFWWRFYDAARSVPSVLKALLLGGLVGLAYLAKPQGILLVAPLLILFILALRGGAVRERLRTLLLPALASAAPVLVAIAIGMLFARLAGNPALFQSGVSGFHGISQYLGQYTANGFARPYFLFVTSFWGYFGWFQVDLPSYVYVVIVILAAVGLGGALRQLFTRSGPPDLILISFLGMVAAAALLLGLEVYTYRSAGVLVLQGRSFLMLSIPLFYLLLRGWQGWVPLRTAPTLAAATLILALSLNVVSLFQLLDAFYG